MVIGRQLVPVMCRSRHIPLVLFLAAAAALVLEAVPIEVWVLPVCVLAGAPQWREPLWVATGTFFAMVLMYALGRIGGLETVGFMLETSGLKGIHDYQIARETFGGWMPMFAGWVGPTARDIAVMAGQRGVPSPWIYFPLAAVHVLIRGAALGLVAARARRSAMVVRLSSDFAVLWWLSLAAVSWILASMG